MRQPNFKKRKSSLESDELVRNVLDNGDVCTAKPSAIFTPTGGRSHTLSIAIPGSIIANAPSLEQKTHLAGAIARALAVFCVDEVVIFDDNGDDDGDNDSINNNTPQTRKMSSNEYTAFSDPSHFLAHVLSYLETPPYLRKHLFPMHPNLRTAGLLPSLDMPHHLRQNEWCDYREGVVISGRGPRGDDRKSKNHNNNSNNSPAGHGQQKHLMNNNKYTTSTNNNYNNNNNGGGSAVTIVDTGLNQKVVLRDIRLPERARVTVRFSSQNQKAEAEPVHPSAPRREAGYYWGYYVRRCHSLSAVFTECPFDGGYDLSFGTSERGVPVSDILDGETNSPQRGTSDGGVQSFPDYKHLLVVFGGVAGIEAAIRNDRQLQGMAIRPADADKLFDYWVNLLPGQGSRTIRTEEAVWLGLTSLRRLVERNTQHYHPHRHYDGHRRRLDEYGHENGYGDGHEKRKYKKARYEDYRVTP